MRQQITITVTLDVDAEAAARLIGDPGHSSHDPDQAIAPISGLTLLANDLALTAAIVAMRDANRQSDALDAITLGQGASIGLPYPEVESAF